MIFERKCHNGWSLKRVMFSCPWNDLGLSMILEDYFKMVNYSTMVCNSETAKLCVFLAKIVLRPNIWQRIELQPNGNIASALLMFTVKR